MEGLAFAHGAAARPCQALPLLEDKSALSTFSRLDDEASAGPMQRLPDVLQMAGDFLLGNAYEPGDIPRRERPLLQFRPEEVTDRVERLCGRPRAIQVIVMPFTH
jgi:hypothetical protein